MKHFVLLPAFAAVFMVAGVSGTATQRSTTRTSPELQQPPAMKMYILDGGTLENINPALFGLTPNEVTVNRLPCPVFLIVHPKGTLIWDAGAVPDSSWTFTGATIRYKLLLPDRERDITVAKPLKSQLAEIGYSPAAINYLVLSHYHYDHTANANEFSAATWLVRQNELDAMFGSSAPAVSRPSTYVALRNSKTVILTADEHDVFGDGSVVVKSAPGHTAGHLVLLVKLAKTGNIVLSGDLYHYQEEHTLSRVPTFEYNADQTRTTRKMIDEYLRTQKAQLWIQHDFNAMSKLKKSPNYYD